MSVVTVNNKGNVFIATSNFGQCAVSTVLPALVLSSACLSSFVFYSNNLSEVNKVQVFAYDSGDIVTCFPKADEKQMEINNSIAKLAKISGLEDNWNGYGAKPFTQEHIEQIRKIIEVLPVQPAIFPTAQESIQLEYEKSNGDYLEFEVFSDGRIKHFSMFSDGRSILEDSILIENMNEIVVKFNG